MPPSYRLEGREGFHLRWAHLGRVSAAVQEDVALDPADVGLFAAIGVGFQAHHMGDVVLMPFAT